MTPVGGFFLTVNLLLNRYFLCSPYSPELSARGSLKINFLWPQICPG